MILYFNESKNVVLMRWMFQPLGGRCPTSSQCGCAGGSARSAAEGRCEVGCSGMMHCNAVLKSALARLILTSLKTPPYCNFAPKTSVRTSGRHRACVVVIRIPCLLLPDPPTKLLTMAAANKETQLDAARRLAGVVLTLDNAKNVGGEIKLRHCRCTSCMACIEVGSRCQI